MGFLMADIKDRRPLASRQSGWAAYLTRRLAATSVTPNQISMASIGAAAVAGAAFWASGHADGAARFSLLIAAALFCQLRLVCNLLDGMVAIEARKSAQDGPFWNEFPDRVADILILAGAGLGIGNPTLGWAAAALAVLTAYVREHGRACGASADYCGPMAKQHRMAVMTLAAILAAFEQLWHANGFVLVMGLWIVAIGSAITVLRRAIRLVTFLRTVVR